MPLNKSLNLMMTIPERLSVTTYYQDLWKGAVAEAERQKVRLFCRVCNVMYNGEAIEDNQLEISQMNPEILDGIISIIGNEDIKKAAVDSHLYPWTNLSSILEGASNVFADDNMGISRVIDHLVRVHKLKNIQFLGGGEPRDDAKIRHESYLKALASHGLKEPFPSQSLPGEFSGYGGEQALEILLDQEKLPIDGIIAVNDKLAETTMSALKKRNIRIPEDMAVVGFDDEKFTQFTVPSMTTVHQPLDAMGARSLSLLVEKISGEKSLDREVIPTEMVRRRSCGCFSQSVHNVDHRIEKEHLNPDWLRRFDDVFRINNAGKLSRSFFFELDSISRDLLKQEKPVTLLQDLLSYYHQKRGKWDSAVEKVFHKGRIFIQDLSLQQQQEWQNRREIQHESILKIGRRLTSSISSKQCLESLEWAMDRLGISTGYLVLHNPQDEDGGSGRSRLVYVMEEGKRIPLENEEIFDPKIILPSSKMTALPAAAYIIMTLRFGTEEQGYVIFQINSYDYILYESLADQISSAINGALLVERIQENSQRLTDGVKGLSQSTDTIVENIHKVSKGMDHQASAVEESAGSIEEMVRNINQTNVSAEKADRLSNDLKDETQRGQRQVEELNRAMENVSDSSKQILEMLKMIKDISERINVLGLNAAIQASKAGSFGRGFNVVAGEIRKLASETEGNIESMELRVQEIFQYIEKSVVLTRDTSSSLAKINQYSDQNADMSDHLKMAMNEQDVGAKEILVATQSLLSITDEVKSALKKQEQATDSFHRFIKELSSY